MTNNILNLSATTLQDCLVQNNRFASQKITAEQIGAETLKLWNELIGKLHSAAYGVYALCENSNLQVESTSVDKTLVYVALRSILAEIGLVNGHKLCANDELATLIIGYAGKRGNSDSPELQLCLSKLRNRQAELREYEKTNGVQAETIAHLREEIDALEEQKKTLLASPDNRIKMPTRSTANSFRLEVEHRIARVIADQQAKSWEELEAEAEAKRKERRAKTKAKKNQSK